jgi:hypothetical protein
MGMMVSDEDDTAQLPQPEEMRQPDRMGYA